MKLHLTPTENQAVALFKKQVFGQLGKQVVQFTLFGSRARQEGNEESDIDILVLLTKRTSQNRDTVIDIAHDIFLEHEIEISPLVLSKDQFQSLTDHERLLAQEINRDGINL